MQGDGLARQEGNNDPDRFLQPGDPRPRSVKRNAHPIVFAARHPAPRPSSGPAPDRQSIVAASSTTSTGCRSSLLSTMVSTRSRVMCAAAVAVITSGASCRRMAQRRCGHGTCRKAAAGSCELRDETARDRGLSRRVIGFAGVWSPVAGSGSYSTPLNSCCTVPEASA